LIKYPPNFSPPAAYQYFLKAFHVPRRPNQPHSWGCNDGDSYEERLNYILRHTELRWHHSQAITTMNTPRVINRILQFEATYVRTLLERPWFGLLTRNHS